MTEINKNGEGMRTMDINMVVTARLRTPSLQANSAMTEQTNQIVR